MFYSSYNKLTDDEALLREQICPLKSLPIDFESEISPHDRKNKITTDEEYTEAENIDTIQLIHSTSIYHQTAILSPKQFCAQVPTEPAHRIATSFKSQLTPAKVIIVRPKSPNQPQLNKNTPSTKKQITMVEYESEIDSTSDCDTDSSYSDNDYINRQMFDINNIGTIGTIRTKSYIRKHSVTNDEKNDEKNVEYNNNNNKPTMVAKLSLGFQKFTKSVSQKWLLLTSTDVSVKLQPNDDSEESEEIVTEYEDYQPINDVFDVNNIGTIGAIRTNSYLRLRKHLRTMNKSEEKHIVNESIMNIDDLSDDDLVIKFQKSRDTEIENDLFDLMNSYNMLLTDVEDNNDDDDGEKMKEILEKFGINEVSHANVYNYFMDVLGIVYCYEIVNVSPIKIRKPNVSCNVKTMIKLNKICKYISYRIINNDWNGLNRQEWIEFGMEFNHFYKTFQYESVYMYNTHNYNDMLVCNEYDICDYNVITMNGLRQEYVAEISVHNLLSKQFEIIIKQMPNICLEESKAFEIGIQFNDVSLYITDRLIIRCNKNYVKSMFIGKFVEDESHIFINLNEKNKYLNISFHHDPKGQYTVFDHKEFSKSVKLKMRKRKTNIAKVFIAQYEGNGQYAIRKIK